MTTHDQLNAGEPAAVAELETPSAQTKVPDHNEHFAPMPGAESAPRGADVQPIDADVQPTDADVHGADNEKLFAADPSGLRARWDDIQAAFVDDPSGCVQKADGLVEEVIDQLTARFADARSQLESQWARGESASTEDLRVALTRYREFFHRLLAV